MLQLCSSNILRQARSVLRLSNNFLHSGRVFGNPAYHRKTPFVVPYRNVAGAVGASGSYFPYLAVAAAGIGGFIGSLSKEVYDASPSDRYSYLVFQKVLSVYGWIFAGVMTSFFSASAIAYNIHRFTPGMLMGCSIASYLLSMVFLNVGIYADDLPLKAFSFLGGAALLGTLYGPAFAFINATILKYAALITTTVFSGLSITSFYIPDGCLDSVYPYFSMGFLLVFASAIGLMFFPHLTMLENIFLYGGSAVFSYFALHRSQKMAVDARRSARYGTQFDSIQYAILQFISLMNLFNVILNFMNRKNRK